MRAKPGVSLSPIGAKFFDGGPELRSMIKVPQVAELVDDHVVKDSHAFAQKLKLEMHGSFLKTDENMRTNVPGVWAIGAVRSGYGGMLTDAAADASRVVGALS